jgi:stage IV sporulation protein FB
MGAGRVIGMLTRDDVLRGLAARRPDMRVRDAMHVRFPRAGAREELDQVVGRLPADGSSVVVFEDDRLVGLLDPEHIGELLAMRGVAYRGAA